MRIIFRRRHNREPRVEEVKRAEKSKEKFQDLSAQEIIDAYDQGQEVSHWEPNSFVL
jgi:hypothetical protein